MKKIVVLLVLSITFLAGCSSSPEDKYTDALKSVGVSSNDIPLYLQSSEKTCQAFERGVDFQTVIAAAAASNLDADMAGIIIAGATTYLCPQFQNLVTH